ncbi:MMPL family transporter [Ectothiorhodospira mobilis]|uniref:MMPL family transporter n=1 Tax=Ectothiorhodospira mobilis TaxID=195064 RepID=UPI001904A31F|nr:RND transporter [Ectothiorhodospira mobilis]
MRWMLHRPRLALALLLGLFLLPGPMLLQLKLNNAPEVYFPRDDPAVAFDRQLRERFPQEQVLVALFEGEDLFDPAFLKPLHETVLAIRGDPRVERVLSVLTADHIRATADGFAVEPLVDPYDLDARTPEQWRQRALSDRFAPGLLVSEDGRALALVVRPRALEDSLQRLALEQTVRQAIRTHGLEPRLTALAGHIALDVAQLRAMITDTMAFIPATLGVGLFLLWWLFRRWLVVILSAAVIATVANAAVALLVIFNQPYTLIASILPPLLSAVAVAMLMHLFNAVHHAAQRGYTGQERVRQAVAQVARPMLFTALTTAAGLASLTASPIRPIGAFGLTAAAGVLLTAALALLILPALIARWDRGSWTRQRGRIQWVDRFTGFCAHLSVRRAGWVLSLTALLLAVGLPQIRHVQVETDLYAFFDEDHPLIQSTQRVESRLSGVMPLEVVFTAPARDGLHDPRRLEHIDRVQRWLEARPEVDYSLALPDFVEEMHWAFHGEDPAFRALPGDPRLIAQYLLVYDGEDLYDVVDRDFRRARLLLNLNAHGASALNRFMDDLRQELTARPPGDLDWDLAGMGRLFADQERLLIQGQLRSLIAVTLLLLALMWILWRSPALAAASMIPNLAPVALIFVVMGTFGIWLDMATAMIAAVAVGIAVDDTIHILHGYRSRRQTGASPAWAIARTFRHAGRAVVATTLVLVAQFLLLGLSAFQPTAAFGLLTALGLVAALLFDLLVLPAMLILMARTRLRTH